jgi:hypothetical protein
MLPVPSTAIHNYYFMHYVYPAQLTPLIMRAQSLQLMESLPRSFHSMAIGLEDIEHGNDGI